MNATSTPGIWEEYPAQNVCIRYDTTRTPNRITIQKRGENPTHIDTDNITVKDVYRAKEIAKNLYDQALDVFETIAGAINPDGYWDRMKIK